VVKRCRFHPELRCCHSSCSCIDGKGSVSVCPLHVNPDGFFLPRKVAPFHVSFGKHALRRK
jgi:hypothetical protein